MDERQSANPVTLRKVKSALRDNLYVLDVRGKHVTAKTEFQRIRLTAAVTAARLYLEKDKNTVIIGRSMGLTPERGAQMVRLGISYMLQECWLRPSSAAADRGRTRRS